MATKQPSTLVEALNAFQQKHHADGLDGSNPFYAWGQDRMWLIKEEINKRLG